MIIAVVQHRGETAPNLQLKLSNDLDIQVAVLASKGFRHLVGELLRTQQTATIFVRGFCTKFRKNLLEREGEAHERSRDKIHPCVNL